MLLRFLEGGLESRHRFASRPEVLKSWPGEILILSSKDDELSMGSLEMLQARDPRARAHLFDEGGHHTSMFFPESYTAALKAFLLEVGSQAMNKSEKPR